jgi:chromosome partitioning protein
MYQAGNSSSERTAQYIRQHLPPNLVFDVAIPRSPAAADAFAAGVPVVLRSPTDPASLAYVNLAARLAEHFA